MVQQRREETDGQNSLAMIANDHDFIRNGSVNDTNNIPVRSDDIVLLVVEVDNHVFGTRTNVVFDALVPQTQISCPVLVEVSSLGSMAIQSLEDGQSIHVRNGNGRNARNVRLSRATGNTGL